MTQPGGSKSATAGRAAPAPLRVEWRDGVCMLTLARPEKMNALSAELVEALIAAVDEAAARGVRLIALRGVRHGNIHLVPLDANGHRHQHGGAAHTHFSPLN